MRVKPVTAAIAALVVVASASAETSVFQQYTLDYDASTPWSQAFGNATSIGFSWNVPTSFRVEGDGLAEVIATFALPNFTLTANAGYTLSNLSVFLGNFAYSFGGEATGHVNFIGATIVDHVTSTGTSEWELDVAPNAILPGEPLTGQFWIDVRLRSQAFQTLSFSGGPQVKMVLFPDVGVTSSMQATNVTLFRITADYVGAVPEPGSYAMLLAGLGAVGWMVRRRRQG